MSLLLPFGAQKAYFSGANLLLVSGRVVVFVFPAPNGLLPTPDHDGVGWVPINCFLPVLRLDD